MSKDSFCSRWLCSGKDVASKSELHVISYSSGFTKAFTASSVMIVSSICIHQWNHKNLSRALNVTIYMYRKKGICDPEECDMPPTGRGRLTG